MTPPRLRIQAKTGPNATGAGLLQLSQELLSALRDGAAGLEERTKLAELQPHELTNGLSHDHIRIAFWVNLYNAFHLHQARQALPSSLAARKRHFFGRQIMVAGHWLSLNDLEHGILRRSRLWWARGWLGKVWENALIRNLRVEALDARVHFALNCGAVSCPPIRFYTAEGLEDELALATRGYFLAETTVAGADVWVPGLLRMYAGDFGGRRGIRAWVQQHVPGLPAGWRLRFKPFDMRPSPDNFA